MQSIHDYDVYIFDCDGVILDSNELKIDAMGRALRALSFEDPIVKQCLLYFRENFGRSRFHHVSVFIERFLHIDNIEKEKIESSILDLYSKQCKELYMVAHVTPGFISFIQSIEGCKYIASGSEQEELRFVFKQRGLDKYFTKIYGSPVKKKDLVSKILNSSCSENAVVIGDAISDLDAARENGIDFIGFIPYSNVKDHITDVAKENKYKTINSWSELL